MSRKDMHTSSNTINNVLPERPETTKQKRKNIWIVCGSSAAFFCIWMLGFMAWHGFQILYPVLHPMVGVISPPGADKINPTVMVDGEFYNWAGTCKKLPEDCSLYGEINHSIKKWPQNDRELVSLFWAEGEIYTTPDENCVYLRLTTSWLDDTVVKFELISAKFHLMR